MTAVLPTLWRRLKTQWRRAEEDGIRPGRGLSSDDRAAAGFHPAEPVQRPSLPEVSIVAPGQRGRETDPHTLPLCQALGTFPPGRVTRRFGVWDRREAHWVAPPV